MNVEDILVTLGDLKLNTDILTWIFLIHWLSYSVVIVKSEQVTEVFHISASSRKCLHQCTLLRIILGKPRHPLLFHDFFFIIIADRAFSWNPFMSSTRILPDPRILENSRRLLPGTPLEIPLGIFSLHEKYSHRFSTKFEK